MSDQSEFLNLWYVAIIFNDLLTLLGTGYKIQLESRVSLYTVSCEYSEVQLIRTTILTDKNWS